eukprot:m.14909 g.14909  ORF g.14909 m.14909 type:complete len:111 (+) comp4844_c0_seq1:115-447(+)
MHRQEVLSTPCFVQVRSVWVVRSWIVTGIVGAAFVTGVVTSSLWCPSVVAAVVGAGLWTIREAEGVEWDLDPDEVAARRTAAVALTALTSAVASSVGVAGGFLCETAFGG